MWILAHGLDVETERRVVHHPGDERHECEGDVGHQVVTEQQFAQVFDVFERFEDAPNQWKLGQRRQLTDRLDRSDEFLR